MTADTMQKTGIEASSSDGAESVEASISSHPLKHRSNISSASNSAHSSDTSTTDTVVPPVKTDPNTTVSPQRSDHGVAPPPNGATVTGPDVSVSLRDPERESSTKPGGLGAVRARHHNLNHGTSGVGGSELDRRSEASSEQTRVSKFKVVKLESKAPYWRGRWQCFDFHDRPKEQPKNAGSTTSERISTDQSSISTTSSVPPNNNPSPATPATLVNTSRNSTADPNDYTTSVISSTSISQSTKIVGVNSKFKVTAVKLPLAPTSSLPGEPPSTLQYAPPNGGDASRKGSTPEMMAGMSGLIPPGLLVRDQLLMGGNMPVRVSDSHAELSAELTRRTTLVDAGLDGSKEISALSLDNKIRQCMDLVGNHLIIAVRGELDQVTSELVRERSRAEQLEFENNALRSENAILRSHATGSGGDIPTLNRNQPSRKK